MFWAISRNSREWLTKTSERPYPRSSIATRTSWKQSTDPTKKLRPSWEPNTQLTTTREVSLIRPRTSSPMKWPNSSILRKESNKSKNSMIALDNPKLMTSPWLCQTQTMTPVMSMKEENLEKSWWVSRIHWRRRRQSSKQWRTTWISAIEPQEIRYPIRISLTTEENITASMPQPKWTLKRNRGWSLWTQSNGYQWWTRRPIV